MTNKIVQLKMLAGGIAHIEIDTPDSKLNVLSQDFFAEFEATLTELEKRIPTGEVRGLVISSAKEDNFFAGADVKEIRFLQAQPSKQIYDVTMHGRGVFNRVNALPYPTVAAINGVCLGGGLELGLACKYRIASTSAKTLLGLPETQLGFLPGWGGSIRLPKLIGLQQGFQLISTGARVDANKAWRLGLVDETAVPADLVARAVEIASGAKPKRYNKPFKQKMIDVGMETAAGRMIFAKMATKMVLATTKGKYPAPMEALKLILKTWNMPQAKAFEMESLIFSRLAVTPVSRALYLLRRNRVEENARRRQALHQGEDRWCAGCWCDGWRYRSGGRLLRL